MAWIKISDENGGIYAKEPEPDPAEIVTADEIQTRIDWVKSQGQMKTQPDQEALDFWNTYHGASPYIAELDHLQTLLNELKAIA